MPLAACTCNRFKKNTLFTADQCRRCWRAWHLVGERVAPLAGGFTGGVGVKPWSYGVTVAVPHLNTPEQLELVVGLYRRQTVRPYLLIVDTGSPPEVCERLERLRADDCEIHYIKAHAYLHSSQPVMVALDLGHALCRTAYLLHTHADCFPARRDLLEWLLSQCGVGPGSVLAPGLAPVVGWEMSPRAGTERWKGTVSHTCTMLHMPTVRAIGATWSLERFYDAEGWPTGVTVGWPDTESGFDRCLRAAGIAPRLLGGEPNFQRHVAEVGGVACFDHARSYAGTKLTGGPYWARAQEYMAAAMAEARHRLAMWDGTGDNTPQIKRGPVVTQGVQVAAPRPPCVHLRGQGGTKRCTSCRGTVLVKTFGCNIHGECTIAKRIDGISGCCADCPNYAAEAVAVGVANLV